MLRVLAIKKESAPEFVRIQDDFFDSSETFEPGDGSVFLMNKKETKPNRAVYGSEGEVIRIIFGDFWIAGAGIKDIPDDIAFTYITMFRDKQKFIKIGNRYLVVGER